MIKVTAHTKPLLDAWWDTAVNTPHVWRFLTGDSWAAFQADPGDGWNAVVYLSDDRATMMRLQFDRSPRTEASVAVYCVHSDRGQRRLSSGRLLAHLPDILRAVNARVLHTTVAATNLESLAINRKRMGEPWGIKPEGMWDNVLGRLVDKHCFRLDLGVAAA